jgi:drug/metabolite transporter (DMT)-like permease
VSEQAAVGRIDGARDAHRGLTSRRIGGSRVYGLLLALFSALLFGAATPASKLLLRELAPFQLAGLLYLGAALAMAPVVDLERRRGLRPSGGRADAARLAGAVLFGGVAGPVLLFLGLRESLAGSVALLLNLEMVVTALLGVVLFREHLGPLGWAGVAAVVGAGALLAGPGGWPGVRAALLVAAACACWGLDNHLTALVDGITPASSTLVKGLCAGAATLAIGCLAEPFVAEAPATAAALATGALSYGVSIALYVASSHALGATRAQSVFASAPFAGAALSFTLLGEPIGWQHAAASPLLLFGVAAVFLSQHAHRHVHQALVHVHSHRHDDGHHLHAHAGLPPSARHTHPHRHERLEHAHPHWPDVHHRHAHPGAEAG